MFKKSLVLAAVMCMVLANVGICAEKEKGLVAYWAFDEGKGTDVKDSAGKNHGVMEDATWVNGKSGKALEFNGTSSFVSVPSSESLNITDAITIEAWVKHSGDAFKQWEAIVAKGDNTYRTHLSPVGSFFGFDVNIEGKYQIMESRVTPEEGKWYFVVSTYDGSEAHIYVDGEQVASGNWSGPIDANDDDLYIGENSGAAGRFFSGVIDEVKIYNRALSAKEIKEQFKPTIKK